MKLLLLADGTARIWQDRMRSVQHPVSAVWRVGNKCWEPVGGGIEGGPDPWEEPAAWDLCIVVQNRRRQAVLPFMLRHTPKIPTLLITPWVTLEAQVLARDQPVKVICAAQHAAQPEALLGLLDLAFEVQSGVMVIGTTPMRRTRRWQELDGRRDVYRV